MRNQAAKQADEVGAFEAIDLPHLERATFGDRGLRNDVLALFDRQAATLAAEISAAPSAIARAHAAHRLRGAALGIGANAVAEAAAVFEAEPEGPEALAEALARLAARVAEARAAVAGLLAHD